MRKIILNLAILFFLSLFFSGCSSFHETYKPLYQVKPEIEKLDKE